MAIAAVFFDWVNTLVHMEPDRHTICVEVCRDHGIDVDPVKAVQGFYAADQRVPEGRPINWSDNLPVETFIQYNNIVLSEAGVAPPDRETTLSIIAAIRQRARDVRFVPFADASTATKALKERDLTIGVLSNMSRPLAPYLERLGLAEAIDFSITSAEVEGSGKPEAPIFLEALKRAGCLASEAIHVGDEPFVDGTGASRVGISPVLLDRLGVHADVLDYPRISTLDELPAMIDSLSA